MFLKSLEIGGFKSFANKTKITIEKGITAIVGPNGSGKSNISDAVKWVLGEQSVKSLRGSKMEDVIFSGTQYRRAVGLAYVSLTLDNSDGTLPIEYSDVTITRKLYRSGESEYYINKNKCRLKDIQELFMDTGIGKEGYSIVGQGKIDAILNGRPDDKRQLIEESVGIVKFKYRKEESRKRLENVNENLIRINDIVSTYSERLEPLEKEKQKAEEFLKLSQELKLKEGTVIISSIEDIENNISDIKENVYKLDESVNNLSLEKKEFETNINLLNKSLKDFEEKNEQSKNQYYQDKTNYQKVLSNKELIKEKYSNLSFNLEQTLKEIEVIKSKDNNLKKSKQELENELKVIKKKEEELTQKINLLDENIQNRTLSLQKDMNLLKNLKDNEIEFLSKISEIKNKRFIFEKNIKDLEQQINYMKQSCEDYENNLEINNKKIEELKNRLKEIEYEINNKNDSINKNQDKIKDSNECINKSELELKNLVNKYNKLEANHQFLENLEHNYEGYNRASKILMQHISKNKLGFNMGKCYILGEIIKVKEDLEKAIEIALGGSISDLITNTDKDARKLIDYLKENKIGRTTFLPLNTIKGNQLKIQDDIKHISGFIGVASELVSYEEKFDNAIKYVLGRTVIAKNMESALVIAKKNGFRFKIVTLEGDVVNPGGSLTGGNSSKKHNNIISRKREILQMENSMKELRLLSDSIEDKITKEKSNLSSLQENVINFKDDIYKNKIEFTKIQSKIEELNNEIAKYNQSIHVSKREIETLNKTLKNDKIKITKYLDDVNNMNQQGIVNKRKIEDLEQRIIVNNKDLENYKNDLTSLRIQKAKEDEVILGFIKDINRVKETQTEYKYRLEDLKLEIKNSDEKKKIYLLEIKQSEERLNSITKSIASFEKYFKDSKGAKIKLDKKLKTNNDKLQEISLEFTTINDKKHKQEILLTKYNTEVEALYTKLREELDLKYEDAKTNVIKNISLESLKLDIKSLKEKIRHLGVVNLGAIEEFKELREKINFMNSQRDDLIKSQEELNRVIDNMTGKMKEVFNENFKLLNKNFKETFKDLFGGGSAGLTLNGDELTGNIEINVQPPGKKLQNINLMSGGEKVLSAIALLFGILKMKPCPFCILDEIEAALDDANVVRYSDFLRRFKEKIQFIIITHRKGTMESSDVLYGVVMEEKGISSIVSLDLKESV